MFRLHLALLSLFIFSSSFAQKKTDYKPSDISTVSPAPYDYKSQKQFKHYTYSSFYLTMRDGNKIAVEVYLPKGLKEGQKVPPLCTRHATGARFNCAGPIPG